MFDIYLTQYNTWTDKHQAHALLNSSTVKTSCFISGIFLKHHACDVDKEFLEIYVIRN